MSGEPSDKNKAPSVTASLGGAATLGAEVQPKVKPVQIWAAAGGAILVLQLYVWIRWITGPYFERVPAGPMDPPMYMKIPLMANCDRALGRTAVRPLVVHRQALGAGEDESRSTACSWCRWD